MRVLLVDDESLIRMDLKDMLEAQGCTVVGEGKNGVEAIQLVKEFKPDIVLMDVKMPKLDGIEAARQIKRLQLCPVVLLTAFSQTELINKAMESGVYAYLVKPIQEEQVLPALKMALHRYNEEAQLRDAKQKLEATLEERKFIRRAVGILMKEKSISEEQAYGILRKIAMDKSIKISEIAIMVIKRQKSK